MAAKQSQADIQTGILIEASGLVNEQTGVADSFIVRVDCDRRTDAFDFKEIKSLEVIAATEQTPACTTTLRLPN